MKDAQGYKIRQEKKQKIKEVAANAGQLSQDTVMRVSTVDIRGALILRLVLILLLILIPISAYWQYCACDKITPFNKSHRGHYSPSALLS